MERRTALRGGQVSPAVEQVALIASDTTIDVVAKRATPGELAAMRLLDVAETALPAAATVGGSVFPRLLDFGNDEAGPWVVTPYYPGSPLDWDAEPPAAVYDALARLHQRHLGAIGLSPDLPRVDDDFLRSTFTGFAAAGIHRAAAAGGHPVHDRALQLLDRFADDDRLRAGLEILPPTLLHGDVYGSNVISGDPPVLIDWGSARIGPALLDVTLAAGPTGLNAYRQAIPVDDLQFAIGAAWSIAVNNAMFLGEAAQRSPEFALQMLARAEAAVSELGKRLAVSPGSRGGRPRGEAGR
ncbi:aminoglycoside phosphotransferase family protein [Kribbella sp. NPDC050124]|uniref:aminoglycoside phosphotransferase family protein n=1 Tax=Kribbella sp. NPDC050124 TaxID=3364114 RepID=UPI0037A29BD0